MIADTSVVFADVDAEDPDHEQCATLLNRYRGTPVLVAAALVEVCQLILSRAGGPALEAAFLRAAHTDYRIEHPTAGDLGRAAELVEQYQDQDGGEGIGYVDAITVAIAERLGETTIATLDEHFTIIRPNHVPHFEVVPGRVRKGRRRR